MLQKNQRQPAVWYTYPQRRLQITAAVPGSNFNRQGGSEFNRYEQLRDFPVGEDYEDEPWYSLWSALCHQGDVYPASFAAVPFIVDAVERDPSRASFNFFALPAAIEIARVENTVSLPENLKGAYFSALEKLPKLATPLLRPGCNALLAQSVLAALAAASGQHAYAKLLTEIDAESVPETLEWFFER